GLLTDEPGEPEGFVPHTTWAHVLESLPRAEFVEMSKPFTQLMLVKSPEELTLVRHSASIGEAACRTMLEMVKTGVDERQVYGAMMEVMFNAGSMPPPPYLILHSGHGNL